MLVTEKKKKERKEERILTDSFVDLFADDHNYCTQNDGHFN